MTSKKPLIQQSHVCISSAVWDSRSCSQCYQCALPKLKQRCDGGWKPIWSIWRTTGVLQGYVLAPFLFVVLYVYLLKKATSQLDSGVVTHYSVPDDTRPSHLMIWIFQITSPCLSQAQAQLSKTAEAATDLGLVISAPNTEYVTVNCKPQPAFQVYGDPINHVSDFRYLGSTVASGSSDLKRRKSLAWCVFWKLEQLWKGTNIPMATRVV